MDAMGIMILIFLGCIVIGVPVAVSAGVAAMIALLMIGESLQVMALTVYTSVDNYPLVAVPCFILAGLLMQKCGLAKRLTNLANSLIGNIHGGLGLVSITGCGFFAALTGSGPATTAAIGSVMVPSMKEEGYDAGYSGAVVACAGGLGVVIPPSIPLILYGVIAEVSITKLFLAGVAPGLLLAILLGATNYIYARKHGYISSERKLSIANVMTNLNDAKWALFAPIIILGGIYSGIFTPTEASVVAILYSLLIGFVFYRTLTIVDFLEALQQAAKLTGIAFIIIFTTMVLGEILTVNDVPQKLTAGLLSITDNRYVLILLIDFMILFLGMFMGVIPMLVLLTPILMPVILTLGVDPILFGIIFVIAAEIGFETPPVGATLYIAVPIAGTSIEKISKAAVWLILAEVVGLILISWFPILTLFLPELFKPMLGG